MHADDAKVVATLELQAETQLFIKFAADAAWIDRQVGRNQAAVDEKKLKRAIMRRHQKKYREKTNKESQQQKRLKHITQRIKTKLLTNLTASGTGTIGIYTVATQPSASSNPYAEANVSDALKGG